MRISKYITLIILTLAVSQVSFAQSEPIWVDNTLTQCKKSTASHYLVVEVMGKEFALAMYDMDGVLKMKGACLDTKGTVFHGDFEFYHPDGSIESKGRYVHGAKVDVWERFDIRGNALAERYYAAFDAKHMAYTYVSQMPRFDGGKKNFQDFLKQKISPLVNKTEFRGSAPDLEVGFVVTEEGQIEGIEFTKGYEPDWDLAALHTIGALPSWIPGKKSGEEVRVFVRLPIDLSR